MEQKTIQCKGKYKLKETILILIFWKKDLSFHQISKHKNGADPFGANVCADNE